MRRMLSLMLLLACGSCSATPASGTVAAPGGARVVSEIEWHDWSPETFARAKQENRIIVVNVVAVWCHWCHVMEETTWADPAVAAVVRERFLPIMVDSDARPDLSERYRPWGWPATAFLSPAGEPILELRGYRKPAEFATLLRELVAEHQAGTLARREKPRPSTRPTDAAIEEIRGRVLAQLDEYYDETRAGWGTRQKYPFPEPVEHALFRARVRDEAIWQARALETLEVQRRLIDPVWGGMYQYSLRGDWDHPHYEKITAIQAGAIANYARAFLATRDKRWLEAARAVAGYMLRFMQDPDGGFWTSQDADLRPREGAPVLGVDYYARSEADRLALGLPRIDQNVYADLNGFMITALVELHVATFDEVFLEAAERAAARIVEKHARPIGGLSHGSSDESPRLYLRDQAAMGRALLSLHRVTGERRHLERAEALARFMQTYLEDPDTGGFFSYTGGDDDPLGRRKPLEENGLAARFLVALHGHLDGDGSQPTPWKEAAERALRAVGAPEGIRTEGRIVGTYLLALEELLQPTLDLTVVGQAHDPVRAALHRAALAWPDPRATVEIDTPGNRYPDIGKAAAYLCTETACSTPITDPTRLSEQADAFVRQ